MEVQAEYSSAGRRPDYLLNGQRERKRAAATWREAISATAITELSVKRTRLSFFLKLGFVVAVEPNGGWKACSLPARA